VAQPVPCFRISFRSAIWRKRPENGWTCARSATTEPPARYSRARSNSSKSGASQFLAEAAPADFRSVERWFCSRIGENIRRPRRFYTGGAMVEDVDVSRPFLCVSSFPCRDGFDFHEKDNHRSTDLKSAGAQEPERPLLEQNHGSTDVKSAGAGIPLPARN